MPWRFAVGETEAIVGELLMEKAEGDELVPVDFVEAVFEKIAAKHGAQGMAERVKALACHAIDRMLADRSDLRATATDFPVRLDEICVRSTKDPGGYDVIYRVESKSSGGERVVTGRTPVSSGRLWRR